jgi:transcriptional regulator with XRE-family HTH domain
MASLSGRDRETVSLFVDEMRAMREARGWSQAELATQTNYSESLIAMVETYQRAPTQGLADALDRAFGTPGFAEHTADGPGSPGTFGRVWHKLRTVSLPQPFRPFAEREAEAVALRTFEHSLIPGLLQTADYARAVIATKPGVTEAEVEADVADRIGRQWILTRTDPPPPLLWVLIDEGVLHRPVASPEVMEDQLGHLIALSKLPNVTIQVVPYEAGGHSGLLGGFIICDMGGSRFIAFVDDVLGGRVVEDTESVPEVLLRFAMLRSEALPRGASRDLIAEVALKRWKA